MNKKPIIKTLLEIRSELTEIIDRASLTDETYIVTKSGKPRVKIVGLNAEELKSLEKDNELV